MRAIAAHFEPVCAKAGITQDEIGEVLGEFEYQMVETTLPFTPGGNARLPA